MECAAVCAVGRQFRLSAWRTEAVASDPSYAAARGTRQLVSVPRCDPRPVEHGGQVLASHRISAVLRMFLCLPAATAIRSRFLRWLSARTMISVDDVGP